MLDDFFIRALLAGFGVALVAGPLGSFVVWRRMAYFGDATAHAAIMGVALGIALDLSIYAGTIVVAVAMAIVVSALASRGQAMDTVLGVTSHAALAIGLVTISFVPDARSNLHSYLFGDILAVGVSEVIWVWIVALVVAGLLIWRWQRLMTATVNEELAMAEGISPRVERLFLSIAIALVVAIAIRIVGALLISAMLIIPAATARRFSSTPEQMAAIASAVAAFSVLGGLYASLWVDSPAGPSIVVAATVFFLSGQVFRRF